MTDITYNLGEKLRELRKKRGISQGEAADFLTGRGLAATQKAVSKWERGDTQPGARQLIALCELYEVRDVLEVFCGLPAKRTRLNSLGRRRVAEYVRLLEGDEEFCDLPERRVAHTMRSIPLYDLPVSAGTGQFLDSAGCELMEVDETIPASAAYAVRIAGDSMTPRYVDRQIVYIKPQQTLNEGETGIFLLNGDAFCKVLSTEGGVALLSLNPKYAPIRVRESDELRILGKVVG